MGTMESLPQEFHQVIACNSEHEHIKYADANSLKGQISRTMSLQDFPPITDKAHQARKQCPSRISIICCFFILDAFHYVSANVLNRADLKATSGAFQKHSSAVQADRVQIQPPEG